jgi:hypothetical protein
MIGAVAVASLSLGGCFNTATSEKVGTIVKFGKEGAFSQTWEGELIRGGLTSGSGAQGRAFDFTVEDERLVPILREAMEKNREVKIYYHREMFAAPWRTETKDNYFVDKVELTGAAGEVVPANGLAPTQPVAAAVPDNAVTREQVDKINENLTRIRQSLDSLAQAIAQKR